MHQNTKHNDNLSSQSDPDIKLVKDIKNEGFVNENYNLFYAPTSPSGYNPYGGIPGNMSMPSPNMTPNYPMNPMSHIPSPSPAPQAPNELFGNNPMLQQRHPENYQVPSQPNSVHLYQQYQQQQVNPQNIYQNPIPSQYPPKVVPSPIPYQGAQPTQVPVNQMPIQQQSARNPMMQQPASMPTEVMLTDIGTRLKLNGNLEEGKPRHFQKIKIFILIF